jgi:NAD(P)-dependent dehydrogenase (short-subunit alcohol dehydrogenase family)
MSLGEKYSLARKSAVVTGAGNGIGRAIALAFAEAGANVACVDLDEAAAEATATKIGSKAFALACDVSSESEIETAAKSILAKFSAIHILVNGAAGNDPNGTVLELSLADWNKVFAVNVGGAFLMSRAILPAMIKAGGGSVIHIASQRCRAAPRGLLRDQRCAHPACQGDGDRPRGAEHSGQYTIAGSGRDRSPCKALWRHGDSQANCWPEASAAAARPTG